MGIAFSIGAVKNFVGSVFDAAANIHDVALKLGISTDDSLGAVSVAVSLMTGLLCGSKAT